MIDRYNAFLYRDEYAIGSPGPLSGVTVGVKANIAVEGMPFHAGLGTWEDRIAGTSAEVVRRLRAEGAVITGILNMEEGALGAKTDNPHFGPTQNPHRHGYSPGGSSGGSGAAVAGGLCDIALGTDTMGSVRIPAAHCGVYGFKPATDSVSQQGLIPADPTLDAIGPLARDLDMLERAGRIVSEFGEEAIAGAGAVLVDHGVDVQLPVATAFEAVCASFEDAPARLKLSHPNSRIRFAGFIGVSKFMARDLGNVAKSDHLSKLLSYGPKRSEADWEEDQAILDRTREEVRDAVDRHGFLIMPTVPNVAFPHTDPEPAAQADFTCLANIAGLPALSLPMGFTADALPMGVQLVGQVGHEAGLFRLAHQLDATLSAYRAPELEGEET